MGRWPAPARCKRRLGASLGWSRAARIQKQLLHHGLAAARQAARDGWAQGLAIEVVLALDGLGPRASRRCRGQLDVDRLVGQGKGSLGVRLRRQVVRARREGIQQLVMVGTDLPHLCGRDLLAAFTALRPGHLVLGPALDGGYWLMGLCPIGSSCRLFAGASHPIPWGEDRVLSSTLEAAEAEGLTPVVLPARMDLDRLSDLAIWR